MWATCDDLTDNVGLSEEKRTTKMATNMEWNGTQNRSHARFDGTFAGLV